MHNSFLLSAAALPLRSLFSFFPWLAKKEKEKETRGRSRVSPVFGKAELRRESTPDNSLLYPRPFARCYAMPIDEDPASSFVLFDLDALLDENWRDLRDRVTRREISSP